MQIKKVVVMFLSFIICMIVFLAGCTEDKPSGGNAEPNKGSAAVNTPVKGDPSKTGDSSKPSNTDSLKFTWYSNYNWIIPKPWNSGNPIHKWLEQNKGVAVQAIGSDGNAVNKLNTMLSSDSLPDVITMDRGQELNQLIKQGKLLPMDEYLDKYPNIKGLVGEKTLNMLRAEDGHIYALPNGFVAVSGRGQGANGYVINKKIYEALGSPPLVTFTDLENYLNQVKSAYPDVIPLGMSASINGNVPAQNIFYTGFAEGRIPEMTQTNGIAGYPEDDQLESIFSDTAYQESMAFTSRLFREGLIDKEALTLSDTKIREKLKQGKYAVYVGYDVLSDVSSVQKAMQAKDPVSGYEIIWPLHQDDIDMNGVYPSSYNSLGTNVVVITSKASDPEKIFKFLDWSVSQEATRILNFGPPGLLWDGIDSSGAPIPNETFKKMPKDKLMKLDLGGFVLLGNNTALDTMNQARQLLLPDKERSWETMASYNVTSRTSFNATEYMNLLPSAESKEAKIAKQIQRILTDAAVQIMFAESDDKVNKIIEASSKQADEAGYGDLLEWKTSKWQQNVEVLNGE